MKKNIPFYSLLFVVLLIPSITFAALDGLRGLITSFGGILNSVIPVLFGLSLAYFFWGVAQFILHDAGNEKTRDDGKKKIMWGVVALFVFVSIYGIIKFVGDAIGIDTPVRQNASGDWNGSIAPEDGGWTIPPFNP
jgi:hypothetical protein